MKKKSPRGIPDFSRHAPKDRPPAGQKAPDSRPAPAPTPAPAVKPQSTSSKSGRRGQ